MIEKRETFILKEQVFTIEDFVLTEHAGFGLSGDGTGELLLPLHTAGEQHHSATEVGRWGQPFPQSGPSTV